MRAAPLPSPYRVIPTQSSACKLYTMPKMSHNETLQNFPPGCSAGKIPYHTGSEVFSKRVRLFSL